MTDVQTDIGQRDFFQDEGLFVDPYPYYEWLRSQGPVVREPHHGVYFVTGYDEALQIYSDPAVWSSCNTIAGPQFPVPLEGDDVSELIERHRDELAFSDQLPSFDPPKHTAHRGLMMRLITPKRMKENEAFMWELADRQIDEFLDRGKVEFVTGYANPFSLLVVADLLGVPEEDFGRVRRIVPNRTFGEQQHRPLEYLYEEFSAYIEDRRANPRPDVMTAMAHATFPDGTLPPVHDVALIAANLFVAGQETTVRLLTGSLHRLAERADLQDQLRQDRAYVNNFIEEMLRLESPIQGSFRLSRVRTEVGGVELAAGTTVFVANGAANRDPRRFENPAEFRLDRPNGRQHLGFAHGIHTCAGAPLARAEAQVTIARFLDRLADIHLDPEEHGPPGDRHFDFVQTYFLQGLTKLFLEFSPA